MADNVGQGIKHSALAIAAVSGKAVKIDDHHVHDWRQATGHIAVLAVPEQTIMVEYCQCGAFKIQRGDDNAQVYTIEVPPSSARRLRAERQASELEEALKAAEEKVGRLIKTLNHRAVTIVVEGEDGVLRPGFMLRAGDLVERAEYDHERRVLSVRTRPKALEQAVAEKDVEIERLKAERCGRGRGQGCPEHGHLCGRPNWLGYCSWRIDRVKGLWEDLYDALLDHDVQDQIAAAIGRLERDETTAKGMAAEIADALAAPQEDHNA